MFNLFGIARKGGRVLAALGLTAAIAACDATLPTVGGPELPTGGNATVALLVPYGSANQGDEGLARSLENAARLAAADLGGGIEIRVYATAGRASTAAAVADQAIAEGADVIIGPLRSDAANAAAVAASDDGINVLAFSNNSSIAGGNLFVLGNTFDNIAARLMRYSAAQGRNRVVVVHGNTPVGEIARAAVARAASGSSAQIVGTTAFEFSQEGITAAAPQIAATVRSTGANAVMLTDGWDIPPQTLTLSGLQGGWFALPDPALSSRFRARYQSAYANPPHPLAGLAYDGVAAVGALAAKDLAPTRSNLTQSSGFAGVNGVFRLKANGTNERALAVAQVTNSQVRIVDQAPKSFSRGGF